ncbi:type VI secretion system baseplate subunit TssF [Pedobacter sp. SYP-B3415]|uniref:type VI secretion system baseplate subunit TssF n=1 Tax=Pedobacter sp. SYP-B3415 TaxID=2496641 RepID=UPI00101BF529|nr:type VI secretion system baseplate subunit TssF [Pedobacter sp. SYP-B3415]
MDNIFYSSKDEIRNRILKNARDFWGVRNASDFDPLVKLLLEALSAELFLVSNDVKNLENRILDKISRILSSDILTSPLPAHGILQALPVEATEVLGTHHSFIYQKKLKQPDGKGEDKTVDIPFSPLAKTRIFNARIRFVASGSHLFKLEDSGHKSVAANTLPGFSVGQNSLFLGIECDPRLTSAEGLSFYFDWRNFRVQDDAYELLSLSKWFAGNQELSMVRDAFFLRDQRAEALAPFRNQNLMYRLTEDVQSHYRNRFLTIEKTDIQQINQLMVNYPDTFPGVFQPASLALLNKPLFWIRIELPAAFSPQMIEELQVYVNAFPVVNKKLREIKHRLRTMTTIIPVKTEGHEQLLAVDSLKDKQGKSYKEVPFADETERADGSFTIRYGGTERFDSRNARELVEYLFELLRDEKAAFYSYGSDFLNNTLKNLEQTLSLIEQKTLNQSAHFRELLNYVVVKPINDTDIMFLDYWLTDAELGNKIKTGSRLIPVKIAGVRPDGVSLLSTTVGGRSRLNASDRIQAYKYGLTTADRVVTKSDIVNFCLLELGDRIVSVDIRKGLFASKNPKEGFVRTTDIFLTPSDKTKLQAEEWESLLALTKSRLEARSAMDLHFRLMVEPARVW